MLKVRVFSGRKQTSAEFDTAVLDACQAKYRAWLARNEAAFRTLTVVDIQGTDEVKCVRPDWYMTISASISSNTTAATLSKLCATCASDCVCVPTKCAPTHENALDD